MTARVTLTAAGGDLGPGFKDPVHDAQAVFRAVLRAMSRPGEIKDLGPTLAADFDPPAPLLPAAAAVCLSLLDLDTRLWIDGGGTDTSAAAGYLSFHTGAPRTTEPGEADFAVVADGAMIPRLDAFQAGTDELPERSATLVVQVMGLETVSPDAAAADAWRLTGPGIDGVAALRVDGLRAGLAEELAANFARFPKGVDLILCAGQRLAALPRTTKVEGA